jgi:hypothetical protein
MVGSHRSSDEAAHRRSVARQRSASQHSIEAIQILPGVIPAVHHVQCGIRPLPPGTMVGKLKWWPRGQIIPGALLDASTGKLSTMITRSAGIVRVGRGPRTQDEGVPRAEGESTTQGEGGSARGAKAFYYCCYVPGGTFRQYPAGGYRRLPKDGVIEGARTTR